MICDHARLLATDQLTAVSSPVVQRYTLWNRKARACGVWCEALAPQTAKSQGDSPPFVPLHHGMTGAFSGSCGAFIRPLFRRLQRLRLRVRTPPFVLLHRGMTGAFSGGCSTSILTSPCVTHDDSSGCMIMQDSSPRPN